MSDQDEALRLAQALNNRQECEDDAAAMLRSQHARIAELEAVARVALEAAQTAPCPPVRGGFCQCSIKCSALRVYEALTGPTSPAAR